MDRTCAVTSDRLVPLMLLTNEEAERLIPLAILARAPRLYEIDLRGIRGVARQLGTDHAKNRHWTPKHTQQRTASDANSSASRLWPVHEPRSAGPQLRAHRKRVQPPSGLPFVLIARVGSAVATCPAPPQRFPGRSFARSFASSHPSPPKRRCPASEIRSARIC